LLVTVNDTPMIYRHHQILHYATFPWGVVVFSTKADLELVIIKKLGLEPIEVKEVEGDAFVQPGWGNISLPAPAAIATYKPWTRADLDNEDWWETHGYEQDQFGIYRRKPGEGNYGYSRDYRGSGGNFRSGDVTGLESRGSRELKTIDAKAQTTPATGPAKTKRQKRKERQQAATTADAAKKAVQALTGSDYVYDGDEEVLETCEYCGYGYAQSDSYYVEVSWDNEPMCMCLDCIMEEITASGTINIVACLKDCDLKEVEETDAVSISSAAERDTLAN